MRGMDKICCAFFRYDWQIQILYDMILAYEIKNI